MTDARRRGEQLQETQNPGNKVANEIKKVGSEIFNKAIKGQLPLIDPATGAGIGLGLEEIGNLVHDASTAIDPNSTAQSASDAQKRLALEGGVLATGPAGRLAKGVRGLQKIGNNVAKSGGKFNSAGQPINAKGQFVSGAGGESAATANGRAAHEAFDAKVKAKASQGWQSQPRLVDADGRVHIPDALTPSGRPIEYKPNTPSGIKQGRRQLKRYEKVTGKKGRLLTY